MTNLLSKLEEIIEEDKAKELPDEEAAPPHQEEDVRKLRQAEEQVAYLSELFEVYVQENVMCEYPGLFSVERLDQRELYRRESALGRLKPSAEHRIVEVVFKRDYFFCLRFSALILSREVEIMSHFFRRGAEDERVDLPLEPEKYRKGLTIDWRLAFEGQLLLFLNWYQKRQRAGGAEKG